MASRGDDFALCRPLTLQRSAVISTFPQPTRIQNSLIFLYSSPRLTFVSIANFEESLKNSRICWNLATMHSESDIFGDFNLYLDIPSAITTFNDFLLSFDLKQHVTCSTKIHGHWLDLLITRSSCKNIQYLQCRMVYQTTTLSLSMPPPNT